MQYDSPHWQQDIQQIFEAYTGVKFWLVGEPSIMPDQWLENTNVKTMKYRDFIGYCDI